MVFTVIAIFFSTILFYTSSFIENLSLRLIDDTGSGRSTTYMLLLGSLLDKDAIDLFFGSGSISSQVFSGNEIGIRENAKYGLSTHSDGLWLAYEYGIFSILLYFYALYKVKIVLVGNDYRNLKLSLFTIILFTFIFSHFMFTNNAWPIYLILGVIFAEVKMRSRGMHVS
jgi:hypothetical protein